MAGGAGIQQVIKINAESNPVWVRLLDAAGAEVTGKVTVDFTITIYKNNAPAASGGGTITELSLGNYLYSPAAGEYSIAGYLMYRFVVAGAVTYIAVLQMVAYDPYDATVLGLSKLTTIDTTTQKTFESVVMRTGNIVASAAGSITLDAGASVVDDYYKDCLVAIGGGPVGSGQVRLITAYVGSTKVATISPNWKTNPSSAVFYVLSQGSVPAVALASGQEVAPVVIKPQNLTVYRRINGQLVRIDDIAVTLG